MTVTRIDRPSMISSGHRVTVDAYAKNGLADDYREVSPGTYRLAVSKAGEPPKLFAGGTADLPAFTASGIAPETLLKLPYAARHFAAALEDLPSVHRLFEEASDPYLSMDHEGRADAIRRVRDWAAGRADLPEIASVR